MPIESGEVDLERGTAKFQTEDICAVYDAFTVPNSLSPDRALGYVSGKIDSVEIKWSGVTKSFLDIQDTVNKFAGYFLQIGTVSFAVTATTPRSTGHGFRFVSDPKSTTVNYAQIGYERNGIFFS